MEEWRCLCPDDIECELTFDAQKAAKKRAMRGARAKKRRRKVFIEAQLNGPLTIPKNNDRWDNFWLTIEEDTDSVEEFSD
jgi:hypothetical protein